LIDRQAICWRITKQEVVSGVPPQADQVSGFRPNIGVLEVGLATVPAARR